MTRTPIVVVLPAPFGPVTQTTSGANLETQAVDCRDALKNRLLIPVGPRLREPQAPQSTASPSSNSRARRTSVATLSVKSSLSEALSHLAASTTEVPEKTR